MSAVYIAGPMTGLPDLNVAAFDAAARTLDALGHAPVNPAADPPPGLTWEEYMRRDLVLLAGCDAVAVLPGWAASRGARLEVDVAHALGMTVLPIEHWRAS